MRVIAGSAKGRRLKGPRDRAGRTRPTSDLVRGAVFSALASMDADLSRVLDLYAGSGARHRAREPRAESCVERDAGACAVIKENLRVTGFASQANVLCMPVARAIPRLEGPYTLVLADPPYDDADAPVLMESLASSALVEDGTVLVLEHSARVKPSAGLGKLALVSARRHGDSAVSIYR